MEGKWECSLTLSHDRLSPLRPALKDRAQRFGACNLTSDVHPMRSATKRRGEMY